MVNGIENQIVVNRTAEYAKQTADRVNAMENAKAFAAHIEKEKTARDTQAVLQTEHSENNRIRREKEGGQSGEEGFYQEENRQDDEPVEEILAVMPSETLGKEIDISV